MRLLWILVPSMILAGAKVILSLISPGGGNIRREIRRGICGHGNVFGHSASGSMVSRGSRLFPTAFLSTSSFPSFTPLHTRVGKLGMTKAHTNAKSSSNANNPRTDISFSDIQTLLTDILDIVSRIISTSII